MSLLKRQRRFDRYDEPLEDPISGVANLFDASVAFIVSMMIALFMAYNMLDMMNPKSEMTITKKNADGQMEIITKSGKEIKVKKVTDKKLSGEGVRLGTAYQLKDGRVVYVPE
ncbi:DUF2149 domain-containing protein [Desulfobacca acetoxidans]|jgi:hypothetical protein|uniref:DUF2149 domain-containing protein n=1 Tax=Desulfobacca acetoxidans (strain ATCC 700848 / DSM 11109 / ASRB2) TaxID=880072 RepID=F2NEP6_DESAR|nr:DUF2149 domain-containing protein [Desulfobacca acetoxidans]AEB08236.1 Protein of unknown function DUF2149 [Desulfobacca acetoxidans DSM 11109]HAY21691.1 DUF2149 domain-containing protein [Desulfobacterales bacterium]